MPEAVVQLSGGGSRIGSAFARSSATVKRQTVFGIRLHS